MRSVAATSGIAATSGSAATSAAAPTSEIQPLSLEGDGGAAGDLHGVEEGVWRLKRRLCGVGVLGTSSVSCGVGGFGEGVRVVLWRTLRAAAPLLSSTSAFRLCTRLAPVTMPRTRISPPPRLGMRGAVNSRARIFCLPAFAKFWQFQLSFAFFQLFCSRRILSPLYGTFNSRMRV